MDSKLGWVLAGFAALALSGVAAAQPRMFGVQLPTPPAHHSPEQIYAQSDFETLPLLATPAQAATADIGAAELLGYVRDQVAISEASRREGDLLWGRVAGRPGGQQATDYLRRKFEEFGLAQVAIQPVPMPTQVFPVAVALTLLPEARDKAGAAGYRFVTAMPQPRSPATDGAGVTAELVYVGFGRDIDLAGKDLHGKGVVLRARALQGGHSTARGMPDALARSGAAFVIIVLDLPMDVLSYNGAFTGSLVPTVAIADYEGRFLESVIANANGAPVTMNLNIANLVAENLVSGNVVGRVLGSSDEYVIVIAHQDAYFYGATDNASGVAAMLGLAKHFANLRERPRRTHIFVATGAHHSGGYRGSVEFAKSHLPNLARTAIVLNSEHVAALQTIHYTEMDEAVWGSAGGLIVANTEIPKMGRMVPKNPAMLGLLKDALASYGVTMLSRDWNLATVGDLSPFQDLQYPITQIIEVGNWYHTSGDIVPTVSGPGLERATRAFAEFLHSVDARSLEELNHDSPH